MKSLNFPELLLNQEKPWKEYDFAQLSDQHPLFKRLRNSITKIREVVNNSEF